MKLYAITIYRSGENALDSRVNEYRRHREVAIFDAAGLDGRNGYRACVVSIDCGGASDALLNLANDPNWLQDQPRKVVWTR